MDASLVSQNEKPNDDSASEHSTSSDTQSALALEFEKQQALRKQKTNEHRDATDFLNLPTRTLTANARLDEFTTETASGQMLKVVKSNATGRMERYELVTFKINDPENPKNWCVTRKSIFALSL